MRIQRKEWVLLVPASLEEVWSFFSRPENLSKLTPDDVAFETVTDWSGIEMYTGMLIQHRIRPLLNIPLNWTSEIKHIEPLRYFIDEQRSGPYAFWHHEHHFRAVEQGTEVRDLLYYRAPLGPLGTLANRLFVARMIDEIFTYRQTAVETIFGPATSLTGSR